MKIMRIVRDRGNSMGDKRVAGIVIYGTFRQMNDFWRRWLDESKALFSLVGFIPTHIGMKSDTINDGKIKTLSRSEKKIREAIYRGDIIEHMSLYTLNKGFHTALDNEFFVTLYRSSYRKIDYVYCEMPFEIYNDFKKEKILDFMFKFIEINKGEVFVMDKKQIGLNYANKGKGDDISKYLTLEILSTFNKGVQ